MRAQGARELGRKEALGEVRRPVEPQMLVLAIAQAQCKANPGEVLRIQLEPAMPVGKRPVAMQSEIEITGLGPARDGGQEPARLAAGGVQAQRPVAQAEHGPEIEAGRRPVDAAGLELGGGGLPVAADTGAAIEGEVRRMAQDRSTQLQAADRQAPDAYLWQERRQP